ncbi:MAG: cytidine deaminase [Puniceicoccaceae bacterium]
MKAIKRDELPAECAAALQDAESALEQSYCPHSGLSVAAGLVLSSGEVVTGINYESVSYGLTLCAERSAITRAQVEGKASEVEALVLSACQKGSEAPGEPLTPCGACRQWLLELSNRLGRDFPVYSFWKGTDSGLAGTVRELLPSAFESFQ